MFIVYVLHCIALDMKERNVLNPLRKNSNKKFKKFSLNYSTNS